MDVIINFATDINGNKVCKFEDEKIAVTIVLKKDYSDVEEKLRNVNILQDIEKALETVSSTDEFKELVDSYGLLEVDRIEG
ncbi:MAG: hypothetical protein KO318_09635 [Methanobacterium sp.]|jgi:hypothetical protein|uniref:Uncharacterized protein n=1 Tax=Methanobacterium subterraneum TaxID=59277 RepID=A0A2H4VNU7_9EURY|nr:MULTISPECIES: hypothetical protein [Methanobacterium]AUB58759.1 hypothetical protein BK008_10865 [Methanobacterium sp. MZ-A1]AUB59759.1 hypothetical protein BK009_03155 [Methanobacterium subterraneum]MCC7560666.1 hypothetical protein [Methanobacterium sp.]PKL73698.1 MAG: hypothetical protein CVV29_02110 [Methanobacteriales archaeon HGW-Methanobacteriales-2]